MIKINKKYQIIFILLWCHLSVFPQTGAGDSPRPVSGKYPETSFNPKKVSLKNSRRIFKPFQVETTIPLSDVLAAGYFAATSRLFIIDNQNGDLMALPVKPMAFRHIAQGTLGGISFVLAFCIICNTGMVMSPVVDGKTLLFFVGGVYNGMMIMRDRQTGSYWDIITGGCLYGKYKGKQLDIISPLKVMTVKQALGAFPNLEMAVPELSFFQTRMNKIQIAMVNRKNGKGYLPAGFRKSMTKTDDRRPGMDMGIGVWNGRSAKYYPLDILKKRNGAVIDTVDNKKVIVFIDLSTGIPAVFFTGASAFERTGDILYLNTGNRIENGQLYNDKGKVLPSKSPNFVFSRWYGFSLTFPGCAVYNVENSN